jgi:polyisoprenoid-binding protein YceI
MSTSTSASSRAPFDLTGDYAFDPNHTRLYFVARHAMVTKVRGTFREVTGSLHLDAAEPEKSGAEVVIQAPSIDTGNEQRDNHLRSNDFLDMDNHPTISFHSTEAAQVDDDHYRLTGDLTIRGVTRPVTLDLEFTGAAVDPYGNQRVGFEGKTTINRKDWGVSWNAALEGGGVLVSEKVTLELDVSATKQQS